MAPPTTPPTTPSSTPSGGKGRISRVLGGAGRALGGAGKTVIQIAASPYSGGMSRKNRIISNVPSFALFGAAAGVALAIFLGLFGTGTGAIIFGALFCGAIAAFIGFFYSYLSPETGRNLMLTLMIIIFLAFIFVVIGYSRTGIMPTFLGEAGPKISYALAVVGDRLACFNPLASQEKFRECWLISGWESEAQAEVIALDVQFKTTDLFYDGKDKEVRAEIQVNNKVGQGIKFTIDPKCYIDDKLVDTESSGAKEGDSLVFYERETMQKAPVVCKIPANFIKDKKNIKVRIDLTRPILNSVQWAVYTIEKESLDKNENLPSEIFEGEGKAVGSMGLPYDFGIGVEESVPLTEGKHYLYVSLKKKIGYTEISKVKQINYIHVGSIGETAPLTYCEGFKKEGDVFALKDVTEAKIIEDRIQDGKTFYCEVEVSPESDPNKVVFKADINYLVDFKKETTILVTGALA